MSDEQRTRHVLAEDLVWIGIKEYEAIYLTNMVVNTYNMRCSRSLQERELRSEKTLAE